MNDGIQRDIPRKARTFDDAAYDAQLFDPVNLRLLRLELRSIDDLEELLDRVTPFGLTTTSIVHSAPVPRRDPPLPSCDRAAGAC